MTHLTLARCLARLRAPALVLSTALSGACETDRLSPSAESESAQPTGALTTANPSFATSISYSGIPFGFWRLEYYQLGSDWSSLQANASPTSIRSKLDMARSRGAHVYIRLAGSDPSRYQNSDGSFSLSKFKAILDQFKNIDLSSYIADGTLAGHMLLDEPSDGSNWNGRPIPFPTLEEAAKYSKTLWPALPTFVRSVPTWLAGASFRWQYLDGGWAQYSARKGQVDSYRDAEVRAANDEGLKVIWGLNVLDGGDGSSGKHFYSSSKYSMSASEVLKYGKSLLAASNSCGFLMWHYRSDYMAYSGILDAMKTLSAAAKNRSASCGEDGGGVPAAQPPPVSSNGSMGQLKSRLFSDMCVDVPASVYANGTLLIAYSCHTGANQVFIWKSTGEIVPWQSQAMCIDAYSGLGRDGDPIGLWSCNGGANQRWSATAAGEIKGINGKCIGPVSTAPANGTKLSLQPCNGSTSQKWDYTGASSPPTT